MKKYATGSLVVLVVLAGLTYSFARRYGYTGWNFWIAFGCLVLILVPYFALSSSKVVEALKARVRGDALNSMLAVACLIVPYLIYALGIGVFKWTTFAKLVLYLVIPSLLIVLSKKSEQKLHWQDLAAFIILLLPLKVSWFSDIWPWPRAQVGSFLLKMLGVDLLLFLFLIVRGVRHVGHTFLIRKSDIAPAVVNFALFLPLGIFVSLSTKFVSFSIGPIRYEQALLTAVGMFFFTAYLEEFLFRGIILNLLTHSFEKYLALLITSLLFGLAHLSGLDWRYFLLASLAGVFYGNAYLKTRTIPAPALVHTFVDLTWKLFFRK